MMDEQKAIKRIKESGNYAYTHFGFIDSDGQALDMAISALEKQIPKKPKKNGYYTECFKKIDTYTCPTCGNVLLTKKMNDRQDTTYCWDCGQRIDWEGDTE